MCHFLLLLSMNSKFLLYLGSSVQCAKSWSGVRNATEYSLPCTQSNLFTKMTEGNEDCLYLNVYTKSLDQNVRKPVMFWIYEGGFFSGDMAVTHTTDLIIFSRKILFWSLSITDSVFSVISHYFIL